MTTKSSRFFKRAAIALRVVKCLLGNRHCHDGTTIYGDPKFVALTVQAIELLRQRVPEAFALLKEHIGDIVCGTPSGVFTDLLRFGPTFVIMRPSFSSGSAEEYAAALAHEAYHCELYSKAKENSREGSIDRAAYAGADAEKMCLEYQCNVLRMLGMPEDKIEDYQGLIHTKWWEVPYEERN